MAPFPSSFRVLVASLLVSNVFAAFTTTPNQHLAPSLERVPLKTRFDLSPHVVQLRAVEAGDVGNLFGNKAASRRFSLRQALNKILSFTTQNKRKKLAALVFAATVWLRGGLLQHHDVPVAHAAPVERLSPDYEMLETHVQTAMYEPTDLTLQLHQTRFNRETNSADSENDETPDNIVASNADDKDKAMEISGGSSESATVAVATSNEKIAAGNGKLAAAIVGAVVVVPSAGLVLTRGQQKGESEDPEGDNTAESDRTATSAPETSSPSNDAKKDLVQSVLDKAKKARQRVDSDTYLKSLQKEKSDITSAISKLTQQIKSTSSEKVKPVEKPTISAALVSQAAEAIGGDSSSKSGTTSSGDIVPPRVDVLTTNTNLPLMAPRFIKARQQPKIAAEEQQLQQKYSSIVNLEDRAFAILVDLGMVETNDQGITAGVEGEGAPFQ